MKKFLLGGSGMLSLMILLGACGETATVAPSTPNTSVVITVTAPANAMPGMTMKPGEQMGSLDAMTMSLMNLSGKEFEIAFMQDMVTHHQAAIDMAKLITLNTKRPELLKLGQDIISAQTREVGDMTGWLANWYNTKPLADNMSAPGMMQMMGDIDKLKSAKDADFDKLFLQMMIQHHQAAVDMAKLLPDKTQRGELLALGQNIITTQSAETAQMKSWQKTWFNS